MTKSGKNDWTTTFETPLKNVKQTLLYMGEQKNSELMVEVNVAFGGGMHKLTASLPTEIKRNTVYTLKVNGKGGKAQLNILEADWEDGTHTDAILNVKGLIDTETSVLSKGVRVNDGKDSVFVSHDKNDFTLALLAEEGAEIQVEGVSEGVEININKTMAKSLQSVANVHVNSVLKLPGVIVSNDYMRLKVYKDGVLKGAVVLVFEPNPIKLEGQIKLDSNGVCDFGKYVDGELGVITLPEGKNIKFAVADGDDLWAKLEQNENQLNRYRILGGWKPNDPKADGRVQQAFLTISDEDGENVEVYTIKRKNYGLPVVDINGTWWCKYNLRGNVKNFEDQVSINDDINVIGNDVKAYIEACTNEEFLKLLGDQYQGGNIQGLKLACDEDENFYYEGFASGADFTNLDADAMVPDGYRLPAYNDYRFFTWDHNSNMGYGNNAFNNGLGQRLYIYTNERELMLGEVNYGPVLYTEFTYQNSKIIFCGLGHQWTSGAGNIAKQMVLLATYGSVGNSWFIEGYPKSEGKGNWYKYGSQNSTKTRTIRCIKSNVEYIYN